MMAAALSAADLQRLDAYGAASAGSGDRAALADRARSEFSGRGVDVATHFLTHNDPRPRNDAYFFVFEALGDSDTALALIRALPRPPTHESGILDRDFGEIAVAVDALLSGGPARDDPRIVRALEQAMMAARQKPYGSGTHELLAEARLIGRCRSAEAARSLRTLANDGDAAIRTAAAEALGQLGAVSGSAALGGAADSTQGAATSPVQELIHLLATDPSPPARRQAAESLALLDEPSIVPGLRRALTTEQDPGVVDAIVQALRRRGAAVDESAQCRSLIGRVWEAGVAAQMIACWRPRGAAREELIELALTGSAAERAAALAAVTSPAPPVPQVRALVVTHAPEPVRFDPPARDRLLSAAVWTLSQGDRISMSSRDSVERALWELSGWSAPMALASADRITPRAARFRASSALARIDASAYDAVRRPRQALLALLVACGISLFARVRQYRRPALLVAASAAGWAVWTLQASGVRDLPPPPLQLLSVAAIAFLSAGLATGAEAIALRRASHGPGTAIRVVLTFIGAGLLAAVVCAATRNARLFPSDMEGWELIFDPIAAMILATMAATVLIVLDAVVLRRFVDVAR